MSGVRDYTGWIVRSEAGRDKGGLLCVVGMDRERKRMLLADGKRRKLARPKAKQIVHVTQITGDFDCPAIRRLRRGEPLSDKELRRALAAFRDEMEA